MSQMDLFTPLLLTTDTRKKLAIGTDIINYLGLPSNSIECDDIGMFIDSLVPWLQSSNFKVSKHPKTPFKSLSYLLREVLLSLFRVCENIFCWKERNGVVGLAESISTVYAYRLVPDS